MSDIEQALLRLADRMKTMLAYFGAVHGGAAIALNDLHAGDLKSVERFLAALALPAIDPNTENPN